MNGPGVPVSSFMGTMASEYHKGAQVYLKQFGITGLSSVPKEGTSALPTTRAPSAGRTSGKQVAVV